ncbi:hypothetical protein ACFYVL_32560 [Streptomyces sp. NPDC004111]|uniref:hypothetical protein n=1 Tax=Streptomyces sp. NPDC004111 TaxID=3364690 RepID=UPI0036ABED71
MNAHPVLAAAAAATTAVGRPALSVAAWLVLALVFVVTVLSVVARYARPPSKG